MIPSACSDSHLSTNPATGGDQAQKSPAQPLDVAQMQHWMVQRAALPWHLPPSLPGCMDSAPMCPVPAGEPALGAQTTDSDCVSAGQAHTV